jgi:hypothetical protein
MACAIPEWVEAFARVNAQRAPKVPQLRKE